MSIILLSLVVLAALLVFASGFWVGAALIRALALPRHAKSPAPAPREGSQA